MGGVVLACLEDVSWLSLGWCRAGGCLPYWVALLYIIINAALHGLGKSRNPPAPALGSFVMISGCLERPTGLVWGMVIQINLPEVILDSV